MASHCRAGYSGDESRDASRRVREEREEFVERHEQRDYPVPPRPIYGSVKDGPGYYEPVPPAHYSCVPRELIRDRLVGEGWRDFPTRIFAMEWPC